MSGGYVQDVRSSSKGSNASVGSNKGKEVRIPSKNSLLVDALNTVLSPPDDLLQRASSKDSKASKNVPIATKTSTFIDAMSILAPPDVQLQRAASKDSAAAVAANKGKEVRIPSKNSLLIDAMSMLSKENDPKPDDAKPSKPVRLPSKNSDLISAMNMLGNPKKTTL